MPMPEDSLAWAVKAFRDERRAGTYRKYRRYINGDFNLEFATPKFRSSFGRMFQAFGYNRCSAVVDAHADRLRVAGWGSDNDALAQLAQNLWDANHMDLREGEIEIEAIGLGDGYVIAELDPTSGAVQFWPQNAEQVRVLYDTDRPGVRVLAAKAWHDDDEHTRLNLYFPGQIEKYRSRTRTPSGMPNTPQAFEPFQPEGEPWPVPLNVNDTVPVFHVANNARINQYGESELRDVLPLQDGLNKTLMDMLVTMEFAAFPQRVLINVDTDEAETAENIQKFQAGVSRLLTLMGSADGKTPTIAEFTAANMAQYLDVAESWDVRISRVTKIPPSYLSITGAQESGISKRMDVEPFTAKIEDRQRAYGAEYAAIVSYGLRLQGVSVDPGALRPNWVPAAPMSQQDTWEVAELKARVGLPLPMLLREAGYEPEQLKKIMGEVDVERRATTVADFAPLEV